MAAKALQEWRRIQFDDLLGFKRITSKNYEKDDKVNEPAEEHNTPKTNRFQGYQKLCLAGLATMFWGIASGVFSHLKEELHSEKQLVDWVQYTLAHWVHYSSFYVTIAIVLMLLGLCASTFPNVSPLAAGMAGLGGYQAIVFIMGNFHVASLKCYSNIEEFFYSFLVASAVITFYWAFSVQDPLILHLFVKTILWVISLPIYGICFFLYQLFDLMVSFLRRIGWFCGATGKCLGACLSSLVNHLAAVYHLSDRPQQS